MCNAQKHQEIMLRVIQKKGYSGPNLYFQTHLLLAEHNNYQTNNVIH